MTVSHRQKHDDAREKGKMTLSYKIFNPCALQFERITCMNNKCKDIKECLNWHL